MRKIIVLSFISLDGVMQAPGGPEEDTSGGFKYGGWTVPFSDGFSGNLMTEQMSGRSDLLLGRKTYGIFASYWQDHADQWPGINEVNKYVASHKPMDLTWENSIQLEGNAAEAVRKLKEMDGPDLQVYGSGDFSQTLLKHDLVDGLWLKIFPVLLGSGKRLFGNGTISTAFSLIDTQVTPTGVIFANYKRAGEIQTGTF